MPGMSRFKIPHIEEPTLRVRTIRYFMTIFCLFFIVFGVGVITGAALLASHRVAECSFIGQFYTGVYLLLAAGCATTFFGMLACLHTQHSSSLQDFVSLCVVVVVVLVLQVLAAVASHILYTLAASGELASKMEQTLEKYYVEERSCVDTLQLKFQCCGVKNYTEWPFYAQNAGSGLPYPPSCQCAVAGAKLCIAVTDLFGNATLTTIIRSTPCHDVLLDDLFETLLIPRIVGPVVSVVEFIFFLMVIYFLRHVENHSLVGAYVVTPSRENTPTVWEAPTHPQNPSSPSQDNETTMHL